jgi:uncharacterized protein (DUF2164 family)
MNSIRNFYRRLVNLIKTLMAVGFLALAGTGAIFVSGAYKPKPEIVEQIKEVMIEKPDPSFNQLLETIPAEYGIKPLEMAVIVNHESGNRMSAKKFEPGKLQTGFAIAKKHGLAGAPDYSEQAREIASSHCAAQVMGFVAEEMGYWWTELYRPEICLRAASKKLSQCFKKFASLPPIEHYEKGYACYNGGGEDARAYVVARTRELGNRLIHEWKLGKL